MNPRDAYSAYGFTIHSDPLLPPEIVKGAFKGMDDLLKRDYDRGHLPEKPGWNPGDKIDALVKIEQPQIASKSVLDLVGHPAIGEAAAEVTDADWIQVFWVQMLIKPSRQPANGVRVNVGWHQDRNYWQIWEEGSELLTAWVALSDVEEDCGPMRFVPGSHQWGLLEGSDFRGQDIDAVRDGLRLPADARWEESPALMQAGGLSLHSCYTLHGSGPNTSGRPRRSFAIHLRTQNSNPVNNQREGVTRYIDDETICPVIYGTRSSSR